MEIISRKVIIIDAHNSDATIKLKELNDLLAEGYQINNQPLPQDGICVFNIFRRTNENSDQEV